jgi:hypothetical protein
MEKIQYIEKPDWISWDAIHECLVQSHQVNAQEGLHMTNQDLTGEALKKKLAGGYCFVALEGNKVVGVFGLKILVGKKWWSWKKKVAYNCLDGILPDYQGTDVYFGLNDLRMKYIKNSDVDMIQSNTAENNWRVRKICKVKKFKTVQYSATGKGADYYSVIMVKWLHGCPYSDRFINLMFKISKFVVKTIWKPGYKYRFWFN